MFEKHSPEAKKGPEKGFTQEEDVLMDEAVGVLNKLEPKGLLKKAARSLAAFSLVMGASSAFAQETKEQRLVPPAQSETISDENQAKEKIDLTTIQEAAKLEAKNQKKNEVAPFDWQTLLKKYEISLGANIENSKTFIPQVVERFSYFVDIRTPDSDHNFYKGMTEKEYIDAQIVLGDSINHSNNAQDFFAHYAENKDRLDNRQKILLLQEVGRRLLNTYNYDMFNANQHVFVSNDKMFDSIKTEYQKGEIVETGLCGNIHDYLTQQAQALGMPAWLQSGRTKTANHIWTGLITEVYGKKQIGFLNYDEFIPTGTLNYRDGLGVWERYQSAIGTFNSYVGNENKVLFPVKSRAQETIEYAAGVDEGTKRLDAGLAEGKIETKENGLEVSLSPEITEFKLNTDSFAFSVFHFIDLQNNPYQSLEALTALSAGYHHRGENFEFEEGTTILHLNTKDLHGGSEATNEIIERLATRYINKKQLTKGEYGEFLMNFGATLEAAARLPLDKTLFPLLPGTEKTLSKLPGGSKIDLSLGAAEAHFSLGDRLIYLDPNNVAKFYVGASQDFRVQIDDFQRQNIILKKAANNFNIGAEVKVHEGTVLNLDVQKSTLDWGNSLNIKAGMADEKIKAGVIFEKNNSAYMRFVPTSTKIEATAGVTTGPKSRIDFYAAQTTEQYKDAPKTKDYKVGLKFTVYLW